MATNVVKTRLTKKSPQLMDRLLLIKSVQFATDILVLVLAFMAAYQLRFDFQLGPPEYRDALHQVPYVVLFQLSAMGLAGVYTFIWRYIGMSEVKSFLNAALWSALPTFALRLWLPETLQVWRVPLSVIVMDTVLGFGGVLGVRVLRRAIYEHYDHRRQAALPASDTRRKRTLLIGAGRAGMDAAREIMKHGQRDLEVRGFVDDDPQKRKSVIQGIRVLGTPADLPRLVAEHEIDHVIISIAEASRYQLKRITDICDSIPVKVRIIPAMYEILEGRVNVSRIRDVQIEDLLGRDPVRLEEEEIRRLITGHVVLVTGGGGSIGSELARQVARFAPSMLLLVERAEFALFNIEREMKETWPTGNVVPLIGDVGDASRMRTILETYRPRIILHAAAHKHVPLMELNPVEAVKNNVLATRVIAQLAGELGVDVFVLISTDKAVRPKSVMGATKRVAELVVQNMNGRFATRFVAVRFGNVIGSAGSVIPIFREQIRKGGPVTVTHPEMMRYFMTIPEASQLVLQAAAIGEGGEIFVLDMGEPVRILDLATDTIRLSGLKPMEDIDIVFTGLRPGEKLFEELETRGESIAKTRHPKIFIGQINAYRDEVVDNAIERLRFLVRNGRDEDLCELLNALLPEASVDASRTLTSRSRATPTPARARTPSGVASAGSVPDHADIAGGSRG